MLRKFGGLGILLLGPVVGGLFPAAQGAVHLIATSPAVTEVVFQLGKGSDLIGVSALSEFPAEAKRLPTIGSLYLPSIERVVRLGPDWIVSDASTPAPQFERAAQALGFRVYRFDVNRVTDLILQSEAFLHRIYGDAGNERLRRYRRCWEKLRPGKGFSFLAFAWLSPPFLIGHRTFLSDLIERVGGRNALPSDWEIPYPAVSEEWVLSHPVDVVYFLSQFPGDEESARRQVSAWWPARKVRVVALGTTEFARASFAPLAHLARLRPGEDWKAPAECDEARR